MLFILIRAGSSKGRTLDSHSGNFRSNRNPATIWEVVTIRKFIIAFMSVLVITSLSFSAFASNETPYGSSYQYQSGSTTYYSDYWTASSYNLTHIAQYLYPLTKTSYWYYNGTSTIQFGDFFEAISQSLYNIGYSLRTTNSVLNTISSYLSDLHDIFADPEDLALNNSQDNNLTYSTSNFFSGTSSSTSIGVGDIGNIKTIGTDFASNFDTGVSGTSLFGLIFDNSNDGPFSWFTQDTLDNLSPSNSRDSTRSGTKSDEDVVDFYADKMAELDKLLGEVAKDD